MLFVEPGTVHAIGPGVVLLETQQTSDVTYRLYDYGRARELQAKGRGAEAELLVGESRTLTGEIAQRP